MRLYSRDDVHGQLAFHKKLIESVRRGRRFVTPQHRGGQLPVVEPAVQIEFFRKTSMERQWQCFDFNKPVEVPDSPQPPADQDDPSMSESSDSSSSSDSSDSEVSKEATTRAAKRPKMVLPTDAPDEVMVASVSYVQHAMIGTTITKGDTTKPHVEPAWIQIGLDSPKVLIKVCTFAKDPLVSKPGRLCWYNRLAACHRKKAARELRLWWTRCSVFS